MVVLLNGAPGVGKSTLADLVVRQRPMMLALDVDGIKQRSADGTTTRQWREGMPGAWPSP
jgi:adenylate kinase family enzyme